MIKAIILDDEERARRVLENLTSNFCPDIKICSICSNVPEAVIAINTFEPDVVFSDIEMPDYTGFELLSFFKDVNFNIVFTTAYSHYAIKAFEVSAIDYLLKPIQIEQLEATVKKLKKAKNQATQLKLEALRDNLKTTEISKIALPTQDGLLFVSVNDIIYIEADGAYTKVHCINTTILVSKRLKFFELLLDERSQFFRVHRSSIININCIKKYSKAESTITLENETTLQISRDKKPEFEKHIKNIRL